MTPRTRRLNRNPVVFGTFALLVGLSGTAAKADALYTVTNLGSSGVTLTTAGGGTIAVSPTGTPAAGLSGTQLASVSNGQVSYSFATTPDTGLVAGQGPLSGFPVSAESLGLSPSVYGSASVTGLLNTNGFAALALVAPFLSDPQVTSAVAYAVQENSGGTFGQPVTITTNPGTAFNFGEGLITIAGVNSGNQALLGTTLGDGAYDTLVYNLATHTPTDLDLLPQFLGTYSNLRPLAIDDEGQILVNAVSSPSTGEVAETLLLTPSGEPLVATPEPGAWIVWALLGGAACFAGKRARMVA